MIAMLAAPAASAISDLELFTLLKSLGYEGPTGNGEGQQREREQDACCAGPTVRAAFLRSPDQERARCS